MPSGTAPSLLLRHTLSVTGRQSLGKQTARYVLAIGLSRFKGLDELMTRCVSLFRFYVFIPMLVCACLPLQVTVMHPKDLGEQQTAMRHAENRPLEYVSVARQPVYDEEYGNIVTGHDVLDYYAKHGHTAEKKLFYLNRAPSAEGVSPYDLLVVPLLQRDMKVGTGRTSRSARWHQIVSPAIQNLKSSSHVTLSQEHYCMSAMGVVTVIDGDNTEFCLLGEWIEEETRYNLLKQMRFFKYFSHNKFFNFWKRKVRLVFVAQLSILIFFAT